MGNTQYVLDEMNESKKSSDKQVVITEFVSIEEKDKSVEKEIEDNYQSFKPSQTQDEK